MPTFADRELSNYDGKPIALYEFRRGGAIRAYASCDQDVVANGITFVAYPISDGGSNQKGTAVTDVFEVTMPSDCDIVNWFAASPPSDTVYLIVRRFHYGDSQAVITWLGQVTSVNRQRDDVSTVSAQQVSVSLKRGGLRLSWQRGCPHALYDQNCQVNKADHAHDAVVTFIGPNYVRFDTPLFDGGNAFWAGGIIEWEAEPGVMESRLIESAAGTDAFLFGFTDGLTVGLACKVYTGCQRVVSFCDGYYRNIENYGGFSWMPNRTPYDGDPIF